MTWLQFHVYRRRGRDARNNLHALASGEVVYFTAGVVVIYNSDEQTQRFYIGHSDDIKRYYDGSLLV